MEQEFENLSVLLDQVIGFVVAFGFQILGALVVLFLGLKLANWAAKKTAGGDAKQNLSNNRLSGGS